MYVQAGSTDNTTSKTDLPLEVIKGKENSAEYEVIFKLIIVLVITNNYMFSNRLLVFHQNILMNKLIDYYSNRSACSAQD